MARRRKSKGRRYKGRKSKKGRSRSKGSLASEVGGALTLYNAAIRNSLGGKSTLQVAVENPSMAGAKDIGAIIKANVKRGDTYLPLLGGAAVHWAKNKPFVSIVLRPVDKLSKKWFHKGL